MSTPRIAFGRLGRPGRGRHGRAARAAWDVLGVLVFALLFFPVYWAVATAFKPGKDIMTFDPVWFPTDVTLQNFADAISRAHFLSSLRNSLVITGSTVAISLLVALLAAVAVGRMRWRGRKAFVLMIIIVQMVPLNVMVIPLYLLLNKAGMTNQLYGVVLTYLAFLLPFTIWTLRGFVINVPVELEEAAMVDGCTRFQAFVRVVLPLILPGLVATSIYAFIQAWNEYVIAYVLLSDSERQTITVWLAAFVSGNQGTQWGALMAGSVLTAVPVVVFFMLIHRRIAAGLLAGAVKG